MQINSVSQTTDSNLPRRNIAEKSEHPVTNERQTKTPEDARKQVEIKNTATVKTAMVEQKPSLEFSRDIEKRESVVEPVSNQTSESYGQTPSEVSLKFAAVYAGLRCGG